MFGDFKLKWPVMRQALALVIVCCLVLLITGCTKNKETVRYVLPPSPVSLIWPFADSLITQNNPTFVWHKNADAVRYHIQVARLSDFVNKTIDTQTSDTTYTTISSLTNDAFYWRVRSQDLQGMWGDWSDAEIRGFIKSDYVNYFNLISQTYTIGVAQDVFVRQDTAYVADGQADLSIYHLPQDRVSPTLYRNIDTGSDDFAKGVFVAPVTPVIDTFPYAFVADMDGKVQALNTKDTTAIYNLDFGTDQNLEDVTGLVKSDTLWILAVSSGFNRRKLSFYKIIFEPIPNPYTYFYQIDMPADAMGLCTDGDYVYIATGSSGLTIVNISDIYNPQVVGEVPLPGGIALSVDVKDNTAYVATDRAGLFVINITNRNDPSILREVNTLGRTKDVQVAGNYAFIADADYGLRAVDISVPDSAHIVATYRTPYAYGLYADLNWIYLCDRDLGLVIFSNQVHK